MTPSMTPSMTPPKTAHRFAIITVHPGLVRSALDYGVWRAADRAGAGTCDVIGLRDFAVDRHGTIDDRPYGGGDGMVLRADCLEKAWLAVVEGAGEKPVETILMSPRGQTWHQAAAQVMAASPGFRIVIAGRFAGVDQRFIDRYVTREVSLGDYIVSGGELAALQIIDSVWRLLPGVLGNEVSAARDSFCAAFDGGLEHPLYTRPQEFLGEKVPDVLMGGDHQAIAAWRQKKSQELTKSLRPDLLRG